MEILFVLLTRSFFLLVALFGFCEWLCEDFFAQLFGEEVLDLDDEDDERFATLEFLGLDLDACACVKDAERKWSKISIINTPINKFLLMSRTKKMLKTSALKRSL